MAFVTEHFLKIDPAGWNVGDSIWIPYPGVWGEVTEVGPDGVMAVPTDRIRSFSTKVSVRLSSTDKCQCGSGSDLRGPGHSDWCQRYAP